MCLFGDCFNFKGFLSLVVDTKSLVLQVLQVCNEKPCLLTVNRDCATKLYGNYNNASRKSKDCPLVIGNPLNGST